MNLKRGIKNKRLVKSILCEKDCIRVLRVLGKFSNKIQNSAKSSECIVHLYNAFDEIDAVYEGFLKNNNSSKIN